MNRYGVEFQIEADLEPELADRLRSAAETSLRKEGVRPPAALTVLLTGDERLRELNRMHRGYDEPTDVLSFPAGESFPETESYLGDIAISVPTARRQAALGGHALGGELVLLLVHGILHLLGYDHAEPAGRDSMWEAQRRILAELGEELVAPAVD